MMTETEVKLRLVNAFIQGAKWWQYHHNGSTAFASEVDEMHEEAMRLLERGTLGMDAEELWRFLSRLIHPPIPENIPPLPKK